MSRNHPFLEGQAGEQPGPPSKAPILMYHALQEIPSVITIRPELFAWQMRWLYENGYQVVSVGQLLQDYLEFKPVPARTVVLTFDDGFESVYQKACPVLARYGFQATVFLVANYCGRSNDWPGQPAQVPRLSDAVPNQNSNHKYLN